MRRCAQLLLLVFAACSRAPEPAEPLVVARALPPRAVADGPRFVPLEPGVTGLQFENELRPENVVAYVYMGAGVAVGDYDADGLPDIYLVSQDGPNKLFRQTAPMRFVDVTASAGGLDGGAAWGTAATFADVDGDGDLDLFVCNLESPNLLYQNQGDGTFVEKAGAFGLATVAASTGAAFADYDNDGDLDLYLLTNRVLGPQLPDQTVAELSLPKGTRKTRAQLAEREPTFSLGEQTYLAGQQDRLLRNDGYARFVDVTAEAGLADHGNGLSVVWWDFDGDGWQDIYVANDFQSPDQLYHNLGDGRFEDVTAGMLPHTAFFGMGCDFGDIDNDGLLDLCVADMSSTTHYMGKMLMGYMDQHRWFLMNADPQQYMRNALYVNTGTGRFQEAAHMAGLASSDWTWAVRFADLDEDGLLDFYATNGIPVFRDNPDKLDEIRRLQEAGMHRQAMDVYRSLGHVDERNIARRNLGGLAFEDVGKVWGLDESGVTHGAVITDLDRDGDLDIVTNNLNKPASLFENRTAGTHRLLVDLRGADGNRFGVGARIEVVAGDLHLTRMLSLTRGYMSAGEAVEHFGLGVQPKIDRLTVRWPTGRVQVHRDLDVDQHLSIREDESLPVAVVAPVPAAPLFASRELPAVHRERSFDDYAVQPLLPHRQSQLGPGVACGDVDGDGRDEFWFGGAAGQSGTLLRVAGNGFESIDGPWSEHAECEDMGAVFFDFDGDGDLDLYVGSGGVEAAERTELLRDRLYVNDGAGRFSVADDDVLADRRENTSCVAAADFDQDGDLDLFVGGRVIPGRYPYAAPSVLLRNDGGQLVDVTAELAPGLLDVGMVGAAVWTDLDDDGFVDLVVAAQWQPVRVFENQQGERLVDHTAALGLTELRGQWNGVAAGDLDGDGDIDLVVTNLGLNTKYKASVAKPMQLFARDFDDNGTLDVVEAKRSDERVLPVRGLSCSSQAMPFVREKFPTFDAFARASLGEIYGDALEGSLKLSCVELQHTVLENRGERFVAHALPRLAQIAPAFGVAVCDFDRDGLLDIVLAHNFYSPEPETGRFDGGLGLLLRGDGALGFEPVAPLRSGIVLPHDQKALVVTDLDTDGAPDFVVGINNAPARAFANSGRGLGIRLKGAAGNVTAIGARLELEQAGGRVVRELAAGDGYLGQSSAIAWFAAAGEGAMVRVRWPDGEVTQHELPAPAGVITLSR